MQTGTPRGKPWSASHTRCGKSQPRLLKSREGVSSWRSCGEWWPCSWAVNLESPIIRQGNKCTGNDTNKLLIAASFSPLSICRLGWLGWPRAVLGCPGPTAGLTLARLPRDEVRALPGDRGSSVQEVSRYLPGTQLQWAELSCLGCEPRGSFPQGQCINAQRMTHSCGLSPCYWSVWEMWAQLGVLEKGLLGHILEG